MNNIGRTYSQLNVVYVGQIPPLKTCYLPCRAISANVQTVSMLGLYGYGIMTKVLNITQTTSTKLIVCDIKIEISIESTLSTLQTWIPAYSLYLESQTNQVRDHILIPPLKGYTDIIYIILYISCITKVFTVMSPHWICAIFALAIKKLIKLKL